MSIWSLNMSKLGSKATIKDLKKLNALVKRIGSRNSMVKFSRIGQKEDLVIHAVIDEGLSIGGVWSC